MAGDRAVTLRRWRGSAWLLITALLSVVLLACGFAAGYLLQSGERDLAANSEKTVSVTAIAESRVPSIEPLTARVGVGATTTVIATIPQGASAAVVTDSPLTVGAAVNECELLIAISGSPVFAIRPTTPLFRDLSLGSEGPDVRSLNETLLRCGLISKNPGETYNWITRVGVVELFDRAGYVAPGESPGDVLPVANTARPVADQMTVSQVAALNAQVEPDSPVVVITSAVSTVSSRVDVVLAERLSLGQKAALRLSGGSEELPGVITDISGFREADPDAEGAYPGHDVTITLDSPLVSGGEQSGLIVIESEAAATTAVPLAAIRSEGALTYVLAQRGGEFVREPVTVDTESDGWAFLSTGAVGAGDVVRVHP